MLFSPHRHRYNGISPNYLRALPRHCQARAHARV
jgi:hypothetical protein